MEGQIIFNVAVFLLGGLLQLWPAFADWWNHFQYRDLAMLGGCVAIAIAFLVACALDVAMSNCAAPIGWDDAWSAIQAALTAFALWQAAHMFVRAGRQSKALARVVARKILVDD